MKVFKKMPWEGEGNRARRINYSDLCPACRIEFRKARHENPGKFPQACEKCKKMMEMKMDSARYPDRE